VSKSEKVAGDTKGRRKEKGNGGITTINQKKGGGAQTGTWEQWVL
jgi:hypothetical protein